MQFSARLLVVLLVAGLSGCGSGVEMKPTLERVAPVSGTLTYKGQPLESYQVIFLPTDGRRPGVGVTDAAGKFKLGTNDVGDGAPLGANKVSLAFASPSSDDSASASPIDDPALLPKPKISIPSKYGNPETSGLTQEVPSGGLSDLKLDLK
jgi:hypothetical protein